MSALTSPSTIYGYWSLLKLHKETSHAAEFKLKYPIKWWVHCRFLMPHSTAMREGKDVGEFSLCLGESLDFSVLPSLLGVDKAVPPHPIYLQFHSSARAELVYTFSRVFTRCTFLWPVRAKHTVRMWMRHSLFCPPRGAETAQCRHAHIPVRTFM